ncbi:hypothetical protein PSTT_03072 [Puccinia striiformis]|uniref:Uncharacterized protein n=1 Tax=Puccinia striiformis TaxID=27350 RepID=A0A2S4VXY6_9BASI|nr:hypothetical protein PSTT_03072 [Puccinia striiformis]
MLRKQVLCIACAVDRESDYRTRLRTSSLSSPPIDPEDSRTSVSDSKELVQPNVYEDSRSTQGKKDEPTSFGGGNDVGEHGQTQEKLSDQPSDRPVRGASGVGNVIDKPEYLYDEEESGILDRLTFYLFYNLFAKRFWPRYSV